MIQSNARIENLSGVRFYEQDIMYDDHIYTEDIEIRMAAEYLSPGIGIALLNNEGMDLAEQKEALLIKLGQRETSVFYRDRVSQRRVKTNSVRFSPPMDNAVFIFSKKGKQISLCLEGEETPLIEYTIPGNWSIYSVGFYSNKGNTLKTIDVVSSVPTHWTVNMHNADGGHISFLTSGFELKDCKMNGEVEQSNISLKAGTYYLTYDQADLYDKACDIKPYVFLENDSEINDDKKNILDGNRFELNQDTMIHLKFKGKNGRIKNINLSTSNQTNYVPTTGTDTVESNGSSIKVLLTDDVLSVTWRAVIQNVPNKNTQGSIKESYVLKTNYKTLEMRHIVPDPETMVGEEYTYLYDARHHMLTVQKGDRIIKVENFEFKSDSITVFKNMDVNVYSFIIRKTTGQVDVVQDISTKKRIPFYVTSPIIVTDTSYNPYDLSSSYRFVLENSRRKYYFTNVEREIFEADTVLMLEKEPSNVVSGIKIYGIYHDAKTNFDDFYRVDKIGIDTIDYYTTHYQRIADTNIRHVDYANKYIYLDPMGDKYSHYVVEYTKEDSYCLNFHAETKTYEVDINNNNKDFLMFYDEPLERDGVILSNQSLTVDMVQTELTPVNDKFIVLRKESYYANTSWES